MTKKYDELFEKVTNRIIENLESADRWQKPWAAIADGSVPHNASTGRPYSGINFFNLGFASERWGNTGWLTYKQATALGGTVPKNSDDNGGCEYVWFMARSSYKDKATGDDKVGFINKCFPVWNVAQIEGLEGGKQYTPPAAGTGAANRLAESLGINLQYGGDRACFIPSIDVIKMPSVDAFKDEASHDATLLHEMVHWTGHSDRLKRQIQNSFGSEGYAFEELVAELGAAMGGALLGIPYEGLQHESYIKSWLKALRSDPKHIVKAAKQASKAIHYLEENGSTVLLAEAA
jgi:antirestriction protein ArdC